MIKSENAVIPSVTIAQMAKALGETPTDKDVFVYNRGTAIGKVAIEYPFRPDHYSIILVNCGTCEFQNNLKKELKTVDDMLIIAPYSWNQMMSISKDFQAQMVSFSMDFQMKTGLNRQHIESFDFFLNGQSKIIRLGSEEAATISAAIVLLKEKLISGMNPYRPDLTMHAFCLLMFELMAIVKHQSNLSKNQLSRQEAYALRFVKLLTQHVKTVRNLSFYADFLGITADYLTKITKITLQHSASALIDEAVIQESKILLHGSTLSIAQIADQMSFTNQFHFSKFFKNKTGHTPSSYRKKEVSWN